MCSFFQCVGVGTTFALRVGVMKYLAKTIVIVSVASLLGVSSTADAKKRSRKQAKAKVTVEQDIPWYEQDLAPAQAPAKKAPKKVKKSTKKTEAPTLARFGDHQRRRSVQPSGVCGAGCDKSRRKMSISKFELVPDDEATKKARAAQRAKAIKAAKARAAKKVVSSK
jgi:hypothetical protein